MSTETNTRSHKELEAHQDAEQQREFMRALLADVRALERMIAEGTFETGVRRIGAELEMFLLDKDWAPARGALPMIEKLKDPHYTTELGQFQLEANCDPQVFTGDGLSKMHGQIDQLVDNARHAAEELGMGVVLMGILPTMRKRDLGLDAMVPSQRYQTLNKIVTALRGGRFDFSIKGLDELLIEHDSVMLEACNSSFQIHFQIAPDEFARMYNLAQVLAGPIMAVSTNSPIVFGKRLWAETRIALFRQAVDTRGHAHIRDSEARVSFGTRWVKDSVVEIFREDIARFRTLVGTDLDEDPMAKLDRGELPLLKALRLHNGTIYRWNRPCYGVIGDKPHLRIENRVMPAGPSVIDQIANSALWFGASTTGPPGVQTRTGAVMGTPVYMSPEQCRGNREVDHRTDIYALGVILYEMLCGTPPFLSDGQGELILMHITVPPAPLRTRNPAIPPALDELVLRALAKLPGERFQTMADLSRALRQAATLAPSAVPIAVPIATPTTNRRPVFATVPLPAATATLSASFHTLDRPPATKPRRRTGLVVLLAGLAVAAGAAFLIPGSPLRREATSAAAPEATAPAPPPIAAPAPPEPPPPTPQVNVRLTSTPPGARVVRDRDGAVIGVTPFAQTRPASSGVEKIRLERDDHRPEAVSVPLDRDVDLTFALRPNAAPPRQRRGTHAAGALVAAPAPAAPTAAPAPAPAPAPPLPPPPPQHAPAPPAKPPKAEPFAL